MHQFMTKKMLFKVTIRNSLGENGRLIIGLYGISVFWLYVSDFRTKVATILIGSFKPIQDLTQIKLDCF